jgi:hypothetical protein
MLNIIRKSVCTSVKIPIFEKTIHFLRRVLFFSGIWIEEMLVENQDSGSGKSTHVTMSHLMDIHLFQVTMDGL